VQGQTRQPPATLGSPTLRSQIIHFINKPMPGGLPKRTARALLDIEDDKIVPIIRDPQKVSAPDYDGDAVFYFPGLRLRTAVFAGRPGHAGDALRNRRANRAAAGLPVLRLSADRGRRGRPGAAHHHRQPRALPPRRQHPQLSRHPTVIVSCGTCMDQLEKYHFEQIFPGCRLLDIHEYLLEKGVRLDGVSGTRYLYHDPCHAPMRTMPGIKVVNSLIGQPVRALRAAAANRERWP
jgi:hypothetical protein